MIHSGSVRVHDNDCNLFEIKRAHCPYRGGTLFPQKSLALKQQHNIVCLINVNTFKFYDSLTHII